MGRPKHRSILGVTRHDRRSPTSPRDFVKATQEPDICALFRELDRLFAEFREWRQEPDVHGSDYGWRRFNLEGFGLVAFDYTKLTIDQDWHLRLVYYTAIEDIGSHQGFAAWLSGCQKRSPDL